ncbi:MAG TPA: hypothetical protein VIK18_02170 [Pirellulales bacterium]
MQAVIDASFPGTSEPTFATAKDAIEHSVRRAADRADDWNSCVGETIDRVAWCGRDLTFYLAGGKAIRLCCTSSSVDWSIETQPSPDGCACDAESDEDVQMLSLNGTSIAWPRAKLARQRVGHEFRRFQPGGVSAYIYAAECKILMVAVLVNSKSGEPFLYWEDAP